jgi:aminopeptidase N
MKQSLIFNVRYFSDSPSNKDTLSVQATSEKEGNLAEVKALLDHPAFSIKNPNCCYSLLAAFAYSAVNFHAADSSGYEFLADQVIAVDKVNHQVAARLVSPFTAVKQVDKGRQALIQVQLKRILAAEGISANVSEIVSKTIE